MKKVLSFLLILTLISSIFVPLGVLADSETISVAWKVYKYNGFSLSGEDAGDTYNGQKRYFVAYASNSMDVLVQNKTTSFSSTESYANARVAHVSFDTPEVKEGERVFLNITGYNRTTFKGGNWMKLVVTDAVVADYDKDRIKYDPAVNYYTGEKGQDNPNPVKRTSAIDITDFLTEGQTTVYVYCPSCGIYIEDLNVQVRDVRDNTHTFYEKGSYVKSYSEIVKRSTNSSSRAWRDGFVSGNGLLGYVTSGEPYSDAFIFQNNYFNYPTSEPRYTPLVLTSQLEAARQSVMNKNAGWIITEANGHKRTRTRYYSFHPGHQLRLNSAYVDSVTDYRRWVNYETAETGVYYEDKYGAWERVSFTSRADNVSVTKLSKSDEGQLINMTISIDAINEMCKATGDATKQRYKIIVPEDAAYVAMVAKYPEYSGSELVDGGYGGVTYIIAEGENAKKTKIDISAADSMRVGDSSGVKIENAENVYLITVSDRTFNLTGATKDRMTAFSNMTEYEFLDDMIADVEAVKDKYTKDGRFSYEDALAPSARLQKEEFNRISFNISGDEGNEELDNNEIIALQRENKSEMEPMFAKRAYDAARYSMICCSGATAPRLYGMWTGEWNPGWSSVFTVDANVNLQISGMNTGNFSLMQEGYITFFLRNTPDFMKNAYMTYGMHDAIQTPHNMDVDRAMMVQYDNAYPTQYWNSGASWLLLPIYEYWQCFGNTQIPINEYMRIDDLQEVLSVNDGGLSDAEFDAIKDRGYLDLEKDILLPLLTKQANFWEQIVSSEYYMDVNGIARYDADKKVLEEGEKYIIIPTYSPENMPSGYSGGITMNATMDIAAARDGLDMVCAIEEAVKREGYEEAIDKWTKLKNDIAEYKFDSDGALKEWSSDYYEENNNHRHLSHLYPAWPGYETRSNKELARAADIAMDNRNRYNTGDATAGHGWIHKALVDARLKRGDGVSFALLKMMSSNGYYSSLLTDHNTDRGSDSFCTDTAFGSLGAINEAMVFSNTGEIEILPALPPEWRNGKVQGLMARTRAEVTSLSWDKENKTAEVTLTSFEDGNKIKLSCGEAWDKATIEGFEQTIIDNENGNYIGVTLSKDESVTVIFNLVEAENYTFITLDGEESKEFSVAKGKYKLGVFNEYLKIKATAWSTDSIANGVVHVDGTLDVYMPGTFTVTCKTDKGFDVAAKINVSESSIVSCDMVEIVNLKAADNGYNSSWVPENCIDGVVSTAYASKDNTSIKYMQFELKKEEAITSIYAVGRYTEKDGEGTYAKRINGAKIYASNTDMTNLSALGTQGAPMVGVIGDVTATSEFIPAQTPIDTKGEKYKYYLLYFDTLSNGSYRSLALSEIGFYTDEEKVKIDAKNVGGKVLVTMKSKIDGDYVLFLGSYSEPDTLSIAARKSVSLVKNETLSVEFENVTGNSMAVFLWNKKLLPIARKTVVN